MVQYIHTPWRDQEELLRVRQQFYPSSSSSSSSSSAATAVASLLSTTHNTNINVNANANAIAKPDNATTIPHCRGDDENAGGTHAALSLSLALEAEKRQQQAVSRVSMWMQRGGCPHLVESTALLTAAVLSDLHESRTRANSSSYAIRAAYSAAFSRFVTGLLDGQQDKLRKMSMYSIAKNIGLPATFVELRHQATHEQLPSLSKLRTAANNALVWIWDFYWKDLAPVNKGNPGEGSQSDPRRDLLVRYLREQDEALKTGLQKQLKSWDDASLLQILEEIAGSSEEPQIILRALQLSRAILDGGFDLPSNGTEGAPRIRRTKDLEAIRVELQTLNEELEDTHVERVDQPAKPSNGASSHSVGWTLYQGTWKPKPIGVV
ncbi:Las1-like-domain-containing protein [Nemania abortiva]|nr:Las1-like-domain-containing protein [Nemania abortiva]